MVWGWSAWSAKQKNSPRQKRSMTILLLIQSRNKSTLIAKKKSRAAGSASTIVSCQLSIVNPFQFLLCAIAQKKSQIGHCPAPSRMTDIGSAVKSSMVLAVPSG
jgi:hypothetical protein